MKSVIGGTHLTDREFEGFLAEKLDSARKREILDHFLHECHICQGVAQQFWSGGSLQLASRQAEVDRAFELAAQRAEEHRRRLATERAEASSLIESLDSHPPLRRRMLIENRSSYQSWGLCDRLIETGHELRFSDPRRYEDLAESARLVSLELSEKTYGAKLVHDMRGRALAYLANAKRVHTSDLPQVELLLGQAHEELAQGTGDPLELFHVLSFERALRMRQQRYQEALALCARQRVLAERVNDRHLLGKALQDTGLALRELERFEEALDSFLLAEECFDPVEDARSLSAARFNRIGTLDDLGRRREALAEIEPLRMLLLELGDRLNLLRLRAMEGEFALSLHDHALAEHCFREARNGFIALDIGWEAAEVSLYLAQALLLAGRTRETKELAEQILPIFRSASLTTEAVAAILLFREALLSETVSLQLIRHTLDLLREEQQHKQSSRS